MLRLSLDADPTLARPLPRRACRLRPRPARTAPRITGGLTAHHPQGLRGSLRYRHIGERPANEDGSVRAEGYTVVDVGTAYSFGRAELSLTVENLFDVAWNEAPFDTESRLPRETASVSELHFTPRNPLNVQLLLGYRF